MQLVPVFVRRGGARRFLERVSGRCSHAGGRRDRLDGNLRKPELEHHLHLQQSVEVLLPGNEMRKDEFKAKEKAEKMAN